MTRLLFIRYKKSKNIFEGGEQCSQKNYNVLSKILGEENITTYYIHDENKKSTPADYLKGILFFFKNYYFGLTPKRTSEIIEIAKQHDVVFIDRSVFGILAKKLKQNDYKGKIITFFHNVEVVYFDAKVSNKSPWKKLLLNCIDKNDSYSCNYSDKIIALNERDNNELIKRYNRKADVLVPIAFKDKYKKDIYSLELTSQKPQCLFLGAYFTANNEGIQWFIENVYSEVNINLKIVGKGMAKLKDDFAIPSEIEVINNAPDLLPYFEEADIMILPIFKGAGMKVKTCESLMYGKNIIGSTEAFEGYEVDFTKVGAKCDTKEEFIAALNDFINKPRKRFNEDSREAYLKKYSEDAVISKFEEILN